LKSDKLCVDGHTDGRTDVPTDGRTFPPLMLLGRLGGVDLINNKDIHYTVSNKRCNSRHF